MKKILKLSIPGAPLRLSLNAFKDSDNPLINDWDIFVNDPSVRKADCWFVVEDLPDFDKVCDVPPENIIFLAAETAQPVSYIEESPHMKLFLRQFGKIFTFHQYIDSRTTSTIPFLPWMINSNHGDSIWAEHERDVQFFRNMRPPEKSKLISVICSKQDLTENHRMRVRFVEQLKTHFGEALDWYGNGIDSVPEKWEALAPYKYTIVLENQSRFNVLTEKLGDAYLAHCYPIYWGAPNVGDFFADGSYSVINIEDFSGSIKKITKTIAENHAELKHDQISESRSRVLSELNFVNRILRIASSLEGINSKKVVLASQEENRTHPKNSNFLLNSMTTQLKRIDTYAHTNFLDILKSFYILLRYNKISQLLINRIKAR
jgi:hypothetical protein